MPLSGRYWQSWPPAATWPARFAAPQSSPIRQFWRSDWGDGLPIGGVWESSSISHRSVITDGLERNDLWQQYRRTAVWRKFFAPGEFSGNNAYTLRRTL